MVTHTPVVTVVCLCYNHERFVKEAIESVFRQTYAAVQLIIVDDASTDKSVDVIKAVLKGHPDVPFISLEKNQGNCRAFNKALPLVKGDFIIDLAADDVLLPERVASGVSTFQSRGSMFGIHFSDAENISANGSHISFHSDRFPHATIPQGDVYIDVIQRYFICGPTVMMRTKVMQHLGGYDETLAYEDFDLWIRAAREFKFAYSPQVLVKKRNLSGSLGNVQFKRSGRQLWSTYLVCVKIYVMNKSEAECKALSKRLVYEMKVAFRLLDVSLLRKYFLLWLKNKTTFGYPRP